MATLADALRPWADRPVVDKTGLTGTYRIVMNFDRGSRRAPDVDPRPELAPSLFVAVEQQLGLKLNASRVIGKVLVIDRLERPTEN